MASLLILQAAFAASSQLTVAATHVSPPSVHRRSDLSIYCILERQAHASLIIVNHLRVPNHIHGRTFSQKVLRDTDGGR
jgi:hypothetical protein